MREFETSITSVSNSRVQVGSLTFIDGINGVIEHTRDFMSKDGLMAIVVNDKYKLYQPEKVGFKQVAVVNRHVNRRTGRRDTAFYESILVWKKA